MSVKRPADMMIPCRRCDHSFDAMDHRAWISTGKLAGSQDSEGEALCPYCCIQVFHGREGWAIANSCNGIFAETLEHRKVDADAKLLVPPWSDIEGYVVPVLTFPEHEEDVTMRTWRENTDYPVEAPAS